MNTLLYQRLAADVQLTLLVSNRIYPVYPSPDSGLPYVFYQRLTTTDNHVLAGASTLRQYEFAIDCWAINADTCRSIQNAIYDCLKNWREGTVQGVFLTNDTQEETEAGYHGQLVFVIWG